MSVPEGRNGHTAPRVGWLLGVYHWGTRWSTHTCPGAVPRAAAAEPGDAVLKVWLPLSTRWVDVISHPVPIPKIHPYSSSVLSNITAETRDLTSST